MGNLFSSILVNFFWKKDIRILILGLDNAGKTTILYRLHLDKVVKTEPTIGFNLETLDYKNIRFEVWDLGGQENIRPFWRCYYANAGAIIYVVDSTDADRLSDSRYELSLILAEEEIQGITLLVFANKQDIEGALTAEEISVGLGLNSLRYRQWAIFKCSAINGLGITEGFDWLANALK